MREQQTLGRRIQEARKAAGLSQESLGGSGWASAARR